MHIKICGLTNLDDALAAVEAGADLLGFNLYPPSPRFIAPEICARLVAALPAHTRAKVKAVGVFVNEDPNRVRAILGDCGLDLAQLHGDEPPDHLRQLGGRAFKGVRGSASNDLDRFAAASAGRPALLIDTYNPKLYGGTGQTADWGAARAVASQYPIMLAGGLNPDNVAAAIAQVSPWGVDTASGVEVAPGRKDYRKVVAFVQAARGGT
jgi:phosphoribosylanthranilate isomerase